MSKDLKAGLYQEINGELVRVNKGDVIESTENSWLRGLLLLFIGSVILFSALFLIIF